MSNKPNIILHVANRKTSVKVTVEITKEIEGALAKVIKGLPVTEGITVTKEDVIVAATENYLKFLDQTEKREMKKAAKAEKHKSEKTTKGKDSAKEVKEDETEEQENPAVVLNGESLPGFELSV